MNGLGGLVRDRRMQVGAAIAAGVGLVVLLVRRGQGGGQQAPTLDSSGTDTYNAVSDQMAAYWRQLQALQDQLDQRPTGSPPSASDPTGGLAGQLYRSGVDFRPGGLGLSKLPKKSVSRTGS